jgi:hypothetical protein
MKKLVLVATLSFWSSFSLAQGMTCLNKLLPYSRYSGLHQLTKEEWSNGRDVLDEESAKNAFTALVGGKLMCKSGEIQIKIQPDCKLLHADIPQSNVCYLYTNLGYFFITKDSGSTVNFIFSKDKRFSEQAE